MISAMAAFATSRPSPTISSVGAEPSPLSSRSHVPSGASPSTMRMSMCPMSFIRPATTTSNVASSRSWYVGLSFHCPPISPARTPATGPSNGSPASVTASPAALIPGMSYGFARSADSTVITTWTSSR
jgi:hypothetical protein